MAPLTPVVHEKRSAPCVSCNGKGYDKRTGATCTTCGGSGEITVDI